MSNINWPIGTMGGKVWWNTLKNKFGWKLQQNKLSGHYMVLDPENIRQTWSTDYSEIMHDYEKFTDR